MNFVHRTIVWAAVYCFFTAMSAAAQNILQTRTYLSQLNTKDVVKYTEYKDPYLIVQTGTYVSLAPQQAREKLKSYLLAGALPLQGHFSTRGSRAVTTQTVPLPALLLEGSELKAIEQCTVKDCKIKLLFHPEADSLEKATDKVAKFKEIVLGRLRDFADRRLVRGYEDRTENRWAIKQMIGHLEFLKADYPHCSFFLFEGFWSSLKTACQPVDSFYTASVVQLGEKSTRPIVRLGEMLELSEEGRTLFFQYDIFTTHYFDSSIRSYEVLPFKSSPNRSLVVVTDVLEIDELKKSATIRFLFQGKMETAVLRIQNSDLSAFLDTVE